MCYAIDTEVVLLENRSIKTSSNVVKIFFSWGYIVQKMPRSSSMAHVTQPEPPKKAEVMMKGMYHNPFLSFFNKIYNQNKLSLLHSNRKERLPLV